MKTEVRAVTPRIASNMLKKNFHNRRVSPKHVKFLSEQMKGGTWVFDGQPIRFDEFSRLLDGQHRLNAVIDSGKTIDFLIVSGLTEDTFKVMDTGKGRSGADVFSVMGESYPNEIAVCSKFIVRHGRGLYSKEDRANKVTNTEMINWFNDNKDIVPFIKVSDKLRSDFNGILPKTLIASLHFIFSKKSVTQADEFMAKMCSGLGLGKNDPILVLRKKLVADKIDKATLPLKEKLALIFKAWNLFRKGQTCKFLRWNKDSENFPTII